MKILNGEVFCKTELRTFKRIRTARRAEREVDKFGYKLVWKVFQMAGGTGQASQEIRKQTKTAQKTLGANNKVFSVK